MQSTIQNISVIQLLYSFLPVLVVLYVLYRWSLGGTVAAYSIFRMLLQLLLIGYVLTYIFASEQAVVVVLILALMLIVASWIALRPVLRKSRQLFIKALISIVLGGVSTLALVTVFTLQLDPWYSPHMMIPLAGMIFANAMNTLSVAAERFESEYADHPDYSRARSKAMQAAMIPVINSMFAVGLVSLPGMMTGQILSGVSPLIAVRYQIMVMCMIFGSAGIATACYLWLLKKL